MKPTISPIIRQALLELTDAHEAADEFAQNYKRAEAMHQKAPYAGREWCLLLVRATAAPTN